MVREYSKEQLEIVVTSCLKNAELLVDDAQTLFDKGSYGHAIALSVLAKEEAIKGLIFLGARVGLVKLTDETMRILHEHRAKHILERDYLFLLNTLGSLIAELAHTQNDREKRKKAFAEWINMMNCMQTNGTPEAEKITKIMGEARKLEPLKQKGLYVDLEKTKVVSPANIEEKEASTEIAKAKDLVEDLKPMLEVMKPEIVELVEEIAAEWKKYITRWRREKQRNKRSGS